MLIQFIEHNFYTNLVLGKITCKKNHLGSEAKLGTLIVTGESDSTHRRYMELNEATVLVVSKFQLYRPTSSRCLTPVSHINVPLAVTIFYVWSSSRCPTSSRYTRSSSTLILSGSMSSSSSIVLSSKLGFWETWICSFVAVGCTSWRSQFETFK